MVEYNQKGEEKNNKQRKVHAKRMSREVVSLFRFSSCFELKTFGRREVQSAGSLNFAHFRFATWYEEAADDGEAYMKLILMDFRFDFVLFS